MQDERAGEVAAEVVAGAVRIELCGYGALLLSRLI